MKKGKGKAEENIMDFSREGIVVRTAGGSSWVRLDSTGDIVECKVKGKFRLKGIRTTNPVAVGDRVIVSLPQSAASDVREEIGPGYIMEIFPRRNYIIRRASNLSKESHILAANIDQALLVVTLRLPETPIVFIDRFLATCEAYSVKASLIVNKADLFDEECTELAAGMKLLYEGLGYGFIITSAETGQGIEELKELTRGRLSLMAGNSGVGKSSLINILAPGVNLRTGQISDIHRTGMHTTTFSEMVDLPYGGELIDIPGVKGFGMIDFKEDEVDHYFPEIFRASAECRFDDCRHCGEIGCHVEKMVDEHYIAQSRYASYCNILDEIREGEKYRKGY